MEVTQGSLVAGRWGQRRGIGFGLWRRAGRPAVADDDAHVIGAAVLDLGQDLRPELHALTSPEPIYRPGMSRCLSTVTRIGVWTGEKVACSSSMLDHYLCRMNTAAYRVSGGRVEPLGHLGEHGVRDLRHGLLGVLAS